MAQLRLIRPPSWELGECDIPDGYRFDKAAADRASEFFPQYLRHTKGRRFYGKPFHLLPFQRQDIREVFGRVDDEGNRAVRIYTKFIPKKNGKSEEAAGIAAKLLFADDEPAAEIYGAAADRGQASLVFDVARDMINLSPELRSLAKVTDSRKLIEYPEWRSKYQVVSSEAAGKHGYNSHGVIFDEIHTQKDHSLWNVLTYGAGAARTQPLVVGISTSGIPGESPVAEEQYEQADQVLRGIIPCPIHYYPVLYEAPEEWPWDDELTWRYANPALGTRAEIAAGKAFLDIDSIRKDEYAQALLSARARHSFEWLRLNRWKSSAIKWLDMDQWDACAKPVEPMKLRHLPCYVGVDLSTKLDITAVVVVWLDGMSYFHVLPFFFIPADNLQDRPNMESDKYRTWISQGYITAIPGKEVNFDFIREFIREKIGRHFSIKQIAYDPQFAAQLAQQLEQDGFEMVEFRQTERHYTEPSHELETAIENGRMRHGGNPVLRWMADNVRVKQRQDGAIRPVKPDRLKQRKRIDGIVALLMGMSRAILNAPEGSIDDFLSNPIRA